MSEIAILPDLLINKIAAGEVIERPASVIRELLDNAIDAAATAVEVEVLHGGRKFMKVSDNGRGMDRDDARLCFERHATSKIHSEDELFRITTLGFRGEALPSIASVSKVTLTTAKENADVGTRIEIGAQEKWAIHDAPPIKGATLEIRDIFYNTPARRKFLKTVPTELSHIIDTVIQKAFAYPHISFRLVHNSNEVLHAPEADSLRQRLSQLYGEDMAGEFLDVHKESKAITVTGFVSTAEVVRSSRSHQLIFVNKRPVKNATVNHAVYNAYREVLPRDRHPAYFLFLDIDPEIVDVNVHPAKREVKFERPDDIHRFVGAAVYEALNPGCEVDVSRPAAPAGTGYRPEQTYGLPSGEGAAVSEPSSPVNQPEQSDFFQSGLAPDVAPFFHVGDSYVATVNRNGLVLIDQHAAHERILYEKFLKRASVQPEPLFLPLRIELPVKEYGLILRNREFLRGLGIELEEFGGNNLIIRSLPRVLARADMKALLLDVAAGLLEQETDGIAGDLNEDGLLRNIAARLACHRSVRGREHLSDAELTRMMADLDSADEPEKCPHGRPTRVSLTLDDLNRMFKRK